MRIIGYLMVAVALAAIFGPMIYLHGWRAVAVLGGSVALAGLVVCGVYLITHY